MSGVFLPVLFCHLLAVRPQPEDIFGGRSFDLRAPEEFLTMENRVVLPQGDQSPCERKKIKVFRLKVPIEPVSLVILAVGIVIALLGMTKWVSCQQHGHTLGKKQRREQVPFLS